jgi:EmrB/QacA subfamily drug resistance transporter
MPALALGTLVSTLDISVVNIALPTLSRVFGAPYTTLEWVVLAYMTVITGLLLPLGRVADHVGRRRTYGTGLAVFVAASALCAAAPSVGWLVGARALQGLGASMMMANSAALLVASFPVHERGRALGAFGALVGVGLALGPPLGGLLVGHASWRWIFLLNLPVGLLAIVLLRARVPADPPVRAGAWRAADPVAAFASSGALAALMVALSRGPVAGWGSATVWPLFAIAAALATAFAWRERRARDPLIPLDLLRGPAGTSAALTLSGQAIAIALGFHVPLYLEEALGFDAARSGRWLAVLPVVALGLSPLAGRWADRVGARPLVIAGLAVASAGYAGLAAVAATPSLPALLAGLVTVGIGLGLFGIPNTTALMNAARAHHLGAASGLQATARNLGIATGAALTAALVASRYGAHGGTVLPAGAAHDAGVLSLATRDLFAALAVAALLLSGFALRLPAGTVARPPLPGEGAPGGA